MATTQDELDKGQEDFSAAFAEAEAERPEMTEDEAFGLGPEEPTEDGTSGAQGGEAPAVAVVIEPAADQPDDAAPAEEVIDPKDEQRQKSWEGRLKAREAELKAREDALKAMEAGEPVSDEPAADESAEPAVAEALEDAAEKVESGELTVAQALKTLSADFGEDFTRMLGVLIDAKAAESAGKLVDEKVGKVSQTLDDVLSTIVDDKARAHFEAIAEKHPDFMELSDGDELKSYLAGLDETERARVETVIERGSAKEIIKLLDAVKAAAEPEDVDPAQQEVMDAAEGVRSRGMKLPEKPAAATDYESAWDDF